MTGNKVPPASSCSGAPASPDGCTRAHGSRSGRRSYSGAAPRRRFPRQPAQSGSAATRTGTPRPPWRDRTPPAFLRTGFRSPSMSSTCWQSDQAKRAVGRQVCAGAVRGGADHHRADEGDDEDRQAAERQPQVHAARPPAHLGDGQGGKAG